MSQVFSPAAKVSTEICNLPIGVFDSGVGGLTVLSAIHAALPDEDLIYLGDTARVPYGTKSADSVRQYAEQATRALIEQPIKALVVACNTASAVALQRLAELHQGLPVFGVIEPGAAVSCQTSRNGHIAVLATESTIHGGAYQQAIQRLRPEAQVLAQACSLFVALAEEGWTEGTLVEQVIDTYLQPLFKQAAHQQLTLDAMVLGCTHFPLLKKSIQAVIGPDIELVDSATTTARVLQQHLAEAGLLRQSIGQRQPQLRFLVTDGPERFARVANRFFGYHVAPGQVEVVDIHPVSR